MTDKEIDIKEFEKNIKDEEFELAINRKGKQGNFKQNIVCKKGSDNCLRTVNVNGEKKEETISKRVIFGLDQPTK